MTVLEDFKQALGNDDWYYDFVNFSVSGAAFVNGVGVEDAVTFVNGVGVEDAVTFINGVGAEDAVTFVDGVGVEDAVTFVNLFLLADGVILGLVEVFELLEATRIVSYILARKKLEGQVNEVFLYLFLLAGVPWELKEPMKETIVVNMDLFLSALNDQSDAIKVAERNLEGFALENEDLTGKNLSGLKITSLEGCVYHSPNPPNFSRCDLTGCNITHLVSVEKRWEDLMGKTLQNAITTITNDPDNFNVVTRAEGSVVTTDFDITRVRIWYNNLDIVSRIPIVG